MKIYCVIDNSDEVMTTVNELEALRELRRIMEKHKVDWGWIEEREVK